MRFFNVRQLLFTPGLWIALRFSFARKRFRIINIISAISFAGIVLGVSTLLVVMSVLNGFQQLAWDLFAAVESPVQVLPAESATMQVSDELLDGLESLSGVSSAEPFAEGQAILAVAGGGGELVIVKGMSADAHERLRLQTGRELPLFGDSTVSVGQMLAYQAGISVPQEVKIFSPELISLGLESLSSPWLLPALSFPVARVQSIFSIQRIFNERYVLTSREMARHILLQKEDEFSGIDIWGAGSVQDSKN
ncbi:ABC transporter permease [Prosthecochloris sp. HL-130-GSB]|uniref:ABC transporter permease n=1 Tax=Prosthecochloris sp. HL-130-GSB TaxID=1974213 RepID=UPI001E4CDE17|nr:ABC transporter permease [Prosthecochloris sp. HL-130-GSB]